MTGRTQRTRSQDGAISIMAAVLAVAMIMATSLAVDVGRVAYASRDQQGVTDRAVLDALRHLGDDIPDTATTPGEIWAVVSDSVASTLAGNQESSSEGTSSERVPVIIEIGYTDASCVYDPADPQPGDPEDFCVVYSQDGEGPYYADYQADPDLGEKITTVRVVTESAVDYVFAFLDDEGARDVVKDALGTNRRECTHPTDPGCPPPPPPCTSPSDECPDPDAPDPDPDPECPEGECPILLDAEAGISVRSRLLELDSDNSWLLQQLLGDLLGADPASLTLAGFDGLVTADVPLGVLGDAGADVGTVDSLLSSEIHVAELFRVMAQVDGIVGTSLETALLELYHETDPALTVTVDKLITATTEDPDALLRASMDAMTLVMHAAVNAALADGNNAVTLTNSVDNLLGVDLLGLEGLVDVAATLTIIEGPQTAYGKVRYDEGTGRYGTVARTAQVDLDLDLGIEYADLDTLLGPLSDLLTGLLCTLLDCVEDVDVSLSVAQAEAELAGIECTDPTAESDITTIVTSDALVATVDGGDETLVDLHDPGNSVVLIPRVPGEGQATVTDSTLTNLGDVPAVDELLGPVFAFLGISTGTARVAANAVRCDVPVLMEEPLPTD